jgi:hypothetical protein
MTLDDTLKYLELAYYIFAIIGFFSFVWAFFTLVVYRKQLYHSTIARCIDIYRRDFTDIEMQSSHSNCNKYIDFVNEELFYMQQGFIPDDISREWLYGIILDCPVFVNGVNQNPSDVSKLIEEYKLLDTFPRLVHAFTLKGKHDFEVIYNPEIKEITQAKRILVKEILKNIKRYKSN